MKAKKVIDYRSASGRAMSYHWEGLTEEWWKKARSRKGANCPSCGAKNGVRTIAIGMGGWATECLKCGELFGED